MKNKILILIFSLVNVLTFAQGFMVNNCDVDITLNKEGYIGVVEKYDLNFTESKHGIFRDIITEYKLQTSDGDMEKRVLVIQNIEVPGHPFTINSSFGQLIDGKVEIKIGDKNQTLTGDQHYEIRYRVYNAFLFENDIVEFYWNIKPSGWQAVFGQINFKIHVPENIPLSAENCFVYAGNTGTLTTSEDFDYSYSDGLFSAKSHEFTYSVPGQDVTVLLKLPKDAIAKNFISVPTWQKYIWVGILGLLLFLFWLVWLKYGKDDKAISATSYYPPKGIDPAMAGYLINDKDDASDLIALIPHWASQGFITIKEIPKKGMFGTADMELTLVQTPPETITEYEQKMFDGIFGTSGDTVLVSSLRNTFYTTMNNAKKTLKKAAQVYYESKSNKVMNITLAVTVVLSFLLFVFFGFIFGPLASIIGLITCVFMAIMSFYMKKKNREGNLVFSELKGFRQFIKLAEVNRIKTLIELDNQYFEKTMSYALAFGLLDKWAKKFDALDIPPPNWYSSSGIALMSMSAFSNSFSSSMSSAQSNMVSAPSSSSSGGGGSSGGGFGGGGGGSW